MNVEIKGIGFDNKGARLMLLAVLAEIANDPDIDLVAVDSSTGTRRQRSKAGLHTLAGINVLRSRSFRHLWADLPALFPTRTARRLFRIVTDREVDVVLDASGYVYGDPWGAEPAMITAWELQRLRRKHQKYILLPQAFGPFTTYNIRVAMQKTMDRADLIFARDQTSYDYLAALRPGATSLRLAPDFTSTLQPIRPNGGQPFQEAACIVPNTRMLDKNPEKDRDLYVSFLVACVEHLTARKVPTFILVHESGDNDLAVEIRDCSPFKPTVVRERDALKVKGLLGECRLVISSRYHALVGAFSQSVPCLGAGWSHKYGHLFEDYGCPECLIRLDESGEALKGRIDTLLQGESRTKVLDRLKSANLQIEKQVGEMWQEVRRVMVRSAPPVRDRPQCPEERPT